MGSPEHPLRGRPAAHPRSGAGPPAVPGIQSESDLFLDIFARGGATVDRDARDHPRVPRDGRCCAGDRPRLIRAARPPRSRQGPADRARPGLLRHGRHVRADVLGLRPVAAAAADQGRHGNARTRIGHALGNIDFVQTICMSGDMPTDQIFFHDFDAIFRNTTKPTVLNILERPFTQLLLGHGRGRVGRRGRSCASSRACWASSRPSRR